MSGFISGIPYLFEHKKIRNWIWHSVSLILLCAVLVDLRYFIPVGIVALVFAVKSRRSLKKSDFYNASRASTIAGRCFTFGLAIVIVYAIIVVIYAAMICKC